MNKLIKWIVFPPLTLLVGFFSFLLYETQDEVNANSTNIEEKINTFYNDNRMGGFAVSVFTADSVLFSKGFGYANKSKQLPYTTKTQQYIASVSKTTIGIALLKAQELGLLDLDDPINQHLPFKVFNPAFPNEPITIRQLATHTSSLDYNEQVVESLYIDEYAKTSSLRPFMESYFINGKYQDVKYTHHQPGENWNYSNIGAGLAAYIIEYKSGMSFSDFTQQHIFGPLQMDQTVWSASKADSMLHSKYYEIKDGTIQEVSTTGVTLYPCRDMITNIEDLTTYGQAIMTHSASILKEESFKELLQPNLSKSVTNQELDNHGVFFQIDRNQYGITYELTGGTGGDYCINTMMLFDPKTELGYIFMGNTGQRKVNRINHILTYRALVSLGEHVLTNNPNNTFFDDLSHNWHNWSNRIIAFF